MKNINIPDNARIGDNAFYQCAALTGPNISRAISNANSIGERAFANTGLTGKVEINAYTIGEVAFANCYGLTKVKIGRVVEKIGLMAFFNCTGLTDIYTGRYTPVKIDSRTFLSVNKETCTLHVPFGASQSYSSADGWKEFKNIVEFTQITDAYPKFDTETYEEGTLSYSRSDLQPSTYATFCLPFDTDFSIAYAFDAVYTTNGTALYKPDGKLVLMLKKVDDAIIPAGQAFVAKLGSRVTSITLSNAATFVADESTLQNPSPTRLEVYNWDGKSGLLTENTDINVSYGGAFSTMTGLGSDYETFNPNGTFGPTENGTVKAFRAYVVKGDAATVSKVRSISFGLEDETTGISIITSSPVTDNANAIYSIDGRLVSASGSTSGLPSGIYIINHKKIIVK